MCSENPGYKEAGIQQSSYLVKEILFLQNCLMKYRYVQALFQIRSCRLYFGIFPHVYNGFLIFTHKRNVGKKLFIVPNNL